MRRKFRFPTRRIEYLLRDNLARVHICFPASLDALCIGVYLRLPSVYFHLAEVLPFCIPTGLFQVWLGNPPVDYLPRAFK